MLPRIVAFTGPIGCGKTTAANRICSHLNYQKISFADPLKQMLITMGLTWEDTYGASKEAPSFLLYGKTPRHAMQTLGTEWGRDLIHPDLWVRAWQVRTQNSRGYVAVDDARFPNEFAMIKSLNGIIIRIFRNGVEKVDKHESEKYEPEYDFAVSNHGTEHVFLLAVVAAVKAHEKVAITLDGNTV